MSVMVDADILVKRFILDPVGMCVCVCVCVRACVCVGVCVVSVMVGPIVSFVCRSVCATYCKDVCEEQLTAKMCVRNSLPDGRGPEARHRGILLASHPED